jgi:hypothetical protein
MIIGNKMPTRCNRWIFNCRSYCLLNMFRAPLCPSSGARDYYTNGCCLSYLVLGFQVVGIVWSWGLCVWFAGCSPQRLHICFTETHCGIPNAHRMLYVILDLLSLRAWGWPSEGRNMSPCLYTIYCIWNKLLCYRLTHLCILYMSKHFGMTNTK